MKILLFSPRYYAGGAERSARDLSHALIDLGHQVEMWTATSEINSPEWVVSHRNNIDRLLFPVNYLDPVADWRHITMRGKIDAIKPDDFDIVHLHNIHGHWLSIKAIHRLCHRLPVVWSLRDGWAGYGGVPYDLDPLKNKLRLHDINLKSLVHRPLYRSDPAARKWNAFLSRWMPQPHRLLCPSRWVESLARKSGYFRSVEYQHIPNGVTMTVEIEQLPDKSLARRTLGIPENAKVILMIAANLDSPYKGIPLGIKAIQNMQENKHKQQTHILVLGRNADAIADQLPGFKVTAMYAKNNHELSIAYRASDITLVPSVAEQFGLVAAESLRCKTPIICFNIGGLAEIAGDDLRGLRIEPFDVNAMSRAMARLLNDHSLASQMGEAGLQWVMENCEYHSHVNQTISAYEKAICSFSKPSS